MSWRSTQVQFVYLDAQGAPHDQWPPALGLFSQLPSQIQIQSKDPSGDITIVASILGQTSAPFRLRDALGVQP
jgi:hypothetical protein